MGPTKTENFKNMHAGMRGFASAAVMLRCLRCRCPPGRPTYAVNVLVDALGEVVVDDAVEGAQVEAARNQVRRDENPHLTRPHAAQRRFALCRAWQCGRVDSRIG